MERHAYALARRDRLDAIDWSQHVFVCMLQVLLPCHYSANSANLQLVRMTCLDNGDEHGQSKARCGYRVIFEAP